MELFETLEASVAGLLRQIDELREENKTLRDTAVGLAELRQENSDLSEALANEQRTREQIDGRIDVLLTKIREYTTPDSGAGA